MTLSLAARIQIMLAPRNRPTLHITPFGSLPIDALFNAHTCAFHTETQGLRCRGLGKSVQGRVAFMKAKRRSRPNH